MMLLRKRLETPDGTRFGVVSTPSQTDRPNSGRGQRGGPNTGDEPHPARERDLEYRIERDLEPTDVTLENGRDRGACRNSSAGLLEERVLQADAT
jgi:hypothetical protein